MVVGNDPVHVAKIVENIFIVPPTVGGLSNTGE